MKPDAYSMQVAGLTLESELHGKGWDNSGPTCLLFAGDLRPQSISRLTAVELPGYKKCAELGGASTALRVLGDYLQSEDGAKTCRRLVSHLGESICGLAFGAESWFRACDDARVITSERDIGDDPLAVEVRSVWVLDATGRVTLVQRTRGRQPWVRAFEPGGSVKIGGRLPALLRDVFLPVAAALPEDGADLTAISTCVTLDYPNRDFVSMDEEDEEPCASC